MKTGKLDTDQDLLYPKLVLKLVKDSFWVSCKSDTMVKPVILKGKRKCSFCKIKENNKLKYGPLYEFDQIIAHYYCVLLSTRMKQNGKDNEGILGFLLADIDSELKKSKRMNCVYCRENNATVRCARQGCKKVFHYPCGLEAGALSRFRNDFVSYCYFHRPKQKVPKKIMREAVNTEMICAICYETVDPKDRINSLWAPCCLRTWYHRDCVQKLAQSAGYFFRCATCNDAAKFKTHMEDNGIFVPQQDASWELVPNAYGELLERHSRCDAEECKCPQGREENEEDTRWEIILCRFCGSQGIHVGCGNLKFSDPQWGCATCQSIMKTESTSSNVDDETKDDVNPETSPTPSTSSANEPEQAAAKKRRLSGQAEDQNQRKRERSGRRDSPEDQPNPPTPKTTVNHFIIRIPDFAMAPRTSDKPHTATRPDGRNSGNTCGIKRNTAMLMAEEVLSRVKPAPLSCKIRSLTKKCFVFHFDPFDVREDNTQPVNNLDLSKAVPISPDIDDTSDIEIIEEIPRGTKKDPPQESKKMDSEHSDEEMVHEGEKSPEQQDDEAVDMPECPGEPELIDIASDSDDSEECQEQEMAEIPNVPEAGPSTSTYEGEFPASDVEMSPSVLNEGIEFHYGHYRDVGSQEQEISEDEEEDEPRQAGKKYARKGIKYYYKVKKARLTENVGGVANPDGLHPSPNDSSGYWPGVTDYSSFAPAPSMAQSYPGASNVMRSVSVSGYQVEPGPSSMYVSGEQQYYVYNMADSAGPSVYTTPIISGSVQSEPSTSGVLSPEPSTSGMPRDENTTHVSEMQRSDPPTSEVEDGSSTSGMEISDPSISGTATPLPSVQYLTSLLPGISPILSSQSSTSSVGSRSVVCPRRIFTALDTSSSSEGSNDVFFGDNSEVEKRPS